MQTPEEAIAYLQKLEAAVDALVQRMHSYEGQFGVLSEKLGSDEGHAKGVEIELKQLKDQYGRMEQRLEEVKNELHTTLRQTIDPLSRKVEELEKRLTNHEIRLNSL